MSTIVNCFNKFLIVNEYKGVISEPIHCKINRRRFREIDLGLPSIVEPGTIRLRVDGGTGSALTIEPLTAV